MNDGSSPRSGPKTDLKLLTIDQDSTNEPVSTPQTELLTSREGISVIKEEKEEYADRPQRVKRRTRKKRRPKEDYITEPGVEENNESSIETNEEVKIQQIAR